jgi:hypothetical protein
MQIRISLTSSYDDKEKGVEMPDIEIGKEYDGRAPTIEEVEALIAIFRRCLPDAPTKPKVRELGSA